MDGWGLHVSSEDEGWPWPGGSVGWSVILNTQRLWVQCLVRAHA